jgi:hypothetical protein
VAGGWVHDFDKAAGTLRDAGRLRPAPGAAARAPAGRAGASALEATNDALLARCSPRRTEEAWVTGALGEKVQVWLTWPPGFDRRRKWPLMHNIHGGPHTGRRRHLALPLEHAGLRRAGLRGGERELPRLLQLRPRLQGQHHAPLGRARAAGRGGHDRLAPHRALGGPPARLRHRRQLRRLHGGVDERARARRPLRRLRLPRRLLRLDGHVRRRRLHLAREGAGRPGTGRTWRRCTARARTPTPRA